LVSISPETILKPKVHVRQHLAPEDKARLVLLVTKSKQSAAAICRKHRISESTYYHWRKIFIVAGTEALKRLPKRQGRPTTGKPPKNEDETYVEAEKNLLLQRVEAVRAKNIQRRARMSEKTKLAIVHLINAATILHGYICLGTQRRGIYRSGYQNGSRPTTSWPPREWK
jgi:transposase-like protein